MEAVAPTSSLPKTLKAMGIDVMSLQPVDSAFYGIVPGNAVVPLRQITLPFTFRKTENYRFEFVKFKLADFETLYHAIRGHPTLAKFMAIPHYIYLVLKMPGPNGVISLKGDLKCSSHVIRTSSNAP